MMPATRHIMRTGPLLAMIALAACARDDEAAMRARLAHWFALGETQVFTTRSDCAAGVFALVDGSVGAAMPVADSVPEMLRLLGLEGRAALDEPDEAPDGALVALANAERARGMAMRRAGLEARACMDEAAQAAFHAALVSPEVLLAYDAQTGTLMLIDRENRVLFAAMGAG